MRRRSKKKPSRFSLLLALLLGGAWYGSFWLTAWQSDAFVAAYLASPPAKALSYAQHKTDHSFLALPWRVAHRFEKVSWTQNGITIKTDNLDLFAVPWNPRGFSLRWASQNEKPPSEATLPAFGLGKKLQLRSDGEGRIVLAKDGTFELLDLRLKTPEILIDDQRFLTAARLDLTREQTTREAPQEHKATAQFSDIELDPKDTWPFGPKIRHAALTLRIKGPETDFANAASRAIWRDKGGLIEIDQIALDWPPLGLTGDGTFALDSRGQAQAALTVKIRNMESSLAHLEKESFISKDQGKLLRATLSGPRGGPELSLPVALQNNAVYLGPLLLFRFEP